MKNTVSTRVKFEVLKRDKFTCQYCGKGASDQQLHIDHIRPTSKGGNNRISNLITACFDCNRSKGSTPLEDFSFLIKDLTEEINSLKNQVHGPIKKESVKQFNVTARIPQPAFDVVKQISSGERYRYNISGFVRDIILNALNDKDFLKKVLTEKVKL